MLRPGRTALLALLASLAPACRGAEYRVVIAFQNRALYEQTASIEVFAVASCDALGTTGADPVAAYRSLSFRRDEPSGTLGSVRTSAISLYARTRDMNCQIIAAGCERFDVPPGGTASLRVVVSTVPAGTTCTQCTAGICPLPDAGMPDPLSVPRPIAPLSGSHVTSFRPTLRWQLAEGTDGAQVELCRSRSCTDPTAMSFNATGSSAQPAQELTPGVWYWRLRSRAGASMGTVVSPVWQLHVGTRNAPVASAWGTVSDVNGDGLADLLVGAPNAEANGEARAGYAAVFHGTATATISRMPITEIVGPGQANTHFGTAVAAVGDVNGDGFVDVGVTSPGSSMPALQPELRIYHGGPTGVLNNALTVIHGPQEEGGVFGGTLAPAGDVNGDGYADVLVGSPEFNENRGRFHLYLGSASGLRREPAFVSSQGGAPEEHLGNAFAALGDTDNNGFGEIAVAADGYSGDAGSVFIYRGTPTGIEPSAATRITSTQGHSHVGLSLAPAGDFNGDGYPDLAVGTVGWGGTSDRAFVYVGSATGLDLASPRELANATAITNDSVGVSVAGPGDINGDGLDDVLVGSFGAEQTYSGAAYVYLGSDTATGPLAPAITVVHPPNPAMNFMGGHFGEAVAGGDYNGDGFADAVIGAPTAGNASRGRVIVWPGDRNSVLVAPSNAVQIDGPVTQESYFGRALALLRPRRSLPR